MKFEFINMYKFEFKILRMCHVLGVNKSSFYAWLKRPISKRSKGNKILLEDIKRIHEASNKIYGSPKICKQLKKEGKCVGHNRVAKLMKKHNIKSKVKRKFRNHSKIINDNNAFENIVNRQFTPLHSDMIWCSDITYIPTKKGWAYLCVFIDLFSKMVVGWSVDSNMKSSLVISALHMALRRRKPSKGLIVHSDRGSQYGSHNYCKIIKNNNFVQSMSRKGNCWDNACVESFFNLIKSEELSFYSYQNLEEVDLACFKYIEMFYNYNRIHSSLDFLTPAEHELNKCG